LRCQLTMKYGTLHDITRRADVSAQRCNGLQELSSADTGIAP
jgi:hypothetical protein